MKTLLLVLLLPTLAPAAPASFQRLGDVRFGDAGSEAAAGLAAHSSDTGPGAPGATARYIATPGDVRFTLPVDGTRATYLTLKMWGQDIAGETVSASQGKIKLGSPRVDLWMEGKAVDASDYELLAKEPVLPGRFFYRTIRLPDAATHGKSRLELVLRPAQSIGGGYAKVGGGQAHAVPADVYSRGYYEAFTHVGNFMPEETKLPDPAMVPVEPPGSPVDFTLLRKRLIEGNDFAVAFAMARQLYGPKFEEAAKQNHIPPAVAGLFHTMGLNAYLARADQPHPDWFTPVTGSGSGRGYGGAGYLYMRAFEQPESHYYKDPEMLQRTIALLDGYRRFQGANGAIEIGGGSDGWIGGPHRIPASGGLQGYLMEGLGRSFLAVWPHVKDRPDLLDAKIDSDGDGRPDVTRREAWTALFREYMKNQLRMPGGVANQAQANALGAALANRALKELSPQDMAGQKDLDDLVQGATGLAPHPRGVWMLTQAGVSLEGPGFCPSYGQHPLAAYPDLMKDYGDPRMRAQFSKLLDQFQYMVFPLNGEKGGPLLVSGPEGSRHHEFPGKPLNWLALGPAAATMQNPFACWAFADGARRSRNLEEPVLTESLGVHLIGEATSALNTLDVLPDLAQAMAREEAKNYVLPAMAPGWRIKTEEQVALAMVHDAGRTLYLQRVYDGRYQFVADNAEAYGNVDAEEENGIRTILYGPWLIAQNITATAKTGEEKGRPAFLAALPAVAEARDLVSGKTFRMDKPLEVPPLATVVFDLKALGNPEVRDIGAASH